ncbi:MAG: DNA polymerase III subunit gamma/tau [Clostridia bacterium]|nr:DNA polymerase III subunit gamma/tau [Clostridia bacterium]
MAYQAIYRRWRPLTFDDVVGQKHITQTLKNQIMNGATAHAYLFCGTRGTGKTSTAKILARAVNCENPQNGNPCNECSVCRGLLDESILDVIELDGASKNKVENIREIIDDVMFLPSTAKKKVYIIDEVHMVTQQAFNALLKTLEEPPAHVMFILATTELNKVPITVLSRCQQFDFRRITNKDIADRMGEILTADGYTYDDSALSLIAELGDGSMRDSLSVLDKCVGAVDTHLSFDTVTDVTGIANSDALFDLAHSVATGDTKDALTKIDEIIEKGKELGLFAERFIKYLRDILMIKITQNPDAFLNTSEENAQKIGELSDIFSQERLLRSIDLMSEAYAKTRASTFVRTTYEMAIVKMCEPDTEDSHFALIDRINVLEERLKSGDFVISKNEVPTEEKKTKKSPEPAPKTAQKAVKEETKEDKSEPNADKSDKETVASRWPEIINYIKSHGGMPLYPHLLNVTAKMVNGKLCVVFGENVAMSKGIASKTSNIALIKTAVKEVTGEDIDVACVTPREIGIEPEDPFKRLEELSKTHPEIEFL